ncbi:phosphonate C-P lyase system protein PhnH [Photobacterium sp. GSS17]|uniref:phosphonate C-P lyase system protein PhnH n=1 Tax=Photobacterium sp. GSS17 TaxID=3020715 RepID=UPI00235FAD1D|nr:phosphonate C-P lyase system protein PhnH [Photobacterium sp. GSS17]
MAPAQLIAGLSSPVFDSQQNFRVLMDAMARPGTIASLPYCVPLDGMHPASFGVLLTLLDAKSSLYLAESFRHETIMRNIAFHCQCNTQYHSLPAQAEFALLDGHQPFNGLLFNGGTNENPHHSTTLLIEVEQLENTLAATDGQTTVSSQDAGQEIKRGAEHPVTLLLSGPGIATETRVRVTGLHPSALDYLTNRQHVFPAGLDMVFITRNKVMALPRTAEVKEA